MGNEKRKVKLNTGLAPVQEPPLQTPAAAFPSDSGQFPMNTLRELQYAGLVEIQKQGCGKPNRIYPKSYEAVPNTDFKKSRSGTPED